MNSALFRLLFIVLLFLQSCASYKLNTPLEAEKLTPSLPENLKLTHTMFSLGNLGDASEQSATSLLEILASELSVASENSSLIYLGDNVGSMGFASEGSSKPQGAESRLNRQLNILKNFKGKAYMIPGENEWRKGREGVESLEKYVQDYPDINIRFEPDDGCSGPDDEEDPDNSLTVVFIDSQWWLMDWSREPELNMGCENRSKANFLYFFEEVIKKNRRKNIVIAMHHPLYSTGHHGGNYTATEQLFPLSTLKGSKVYFPLPGLGSALTFFSSVIGSRQDLSHPDHHSLTEGLLASAKKNGSFIFLSAHEKNLQYFEKEEQTFIVSGVGAHKSPTKKGNDLKFGYGAEAGYSKLRFYEDGSVWLDFIVARKGSPKGELIFRKRIKEKLPSLEEEIPESFPEYENKEQKITQTLNPEKKKSGFHTFIWGDHYRDAYHEELNLPKLDLNTYLGGLTPVKRGGGYQTNSLRLRDTTGHEYVIRSILKDPSLIIPHFFSKTFVQDLFEDQFTSAHPFGAFVIPQMADAIGIYHTNPRLFYVPAQPGLGIYNEDFAGEIYLFEERPDDNWEHLPSFGNAKEIISTQDLLENMEEDDDHRVDQKMVLRNRLFSNLIGDLDRHDDQFRWAKFEQDDGNYLYQPIPRDRDQVFAKFDGLLPRLFSYAPPPLKQLTKYSDDNTNIKWINYSARYFDASFLNQMTWEDYEREATFIQQHLSDSIIDLAFKDFPDPVEKLDAEEISEKLKARRNLLIKIARNFYKLNARKVDVVGTYGHELFEVERLNEEQTKVRMYDSNGDGEREELLYERIFLHSETEEIRLYGLDDKDFFYLGGAVDKGIRVRCIGGKGKDEFKDESKVSGLSHKTKIYDSTVGDKFALGKEAKNKTSSSPRYNTYNRRSSNYEFDYTSPYPTLTYNPDDGLIAGAGIKIVKQAHLKAPYGHAHSLGVNYASATRGLQLHYQAEVIKLIRDWDFHFNSQYSGARYTRNFFGLGNETPNDQRLPNDYNRVQQELLEVSSLLKKYFRNSDYSFISLGALFESSKIKDIDDRFTNSSQAARDEIFTRQNFAGAEMSFNFFNADDKRIPTHGIHFVNHLGAKMNLGETQRRFGYVNSSFAFYLRLGSKKLVLASRVGTMHRFGNKFEFYQAASLGGSENLRGYRDERFSGKTSFYHNTDIRISFGKDQNYYVPFTLGINLGYDYGRVWTPEDNSETWYKSVGGGIWLNPFSRMLISTSLFYGTEGGRFQIRSGFFF